MTSEERYELHREDKTRQAVMDTAYDRLSAAERANCPVSELAALYDVYLKRLDEYVKWKRANPVERPQ